MLSSASLVCRWPRHYVRGRGRKSSIATFWTREVWTFSSFLLVYRPGEDYKRSNDRRPCDEIKLPRPCLGVVPHVLVVGIYGIGALSLDERDYSVLALVVDDILLASLVLAFSERPRQPMGIGIELPSGVVLVTSVLGGVLERGPFLQ